MKSVYYTKLRGLMLSCHIALGPQANAIFGHWGLRLMPLLDTQYAIITSLGSRVDVTTSLPVKNTMTVAKSSVNVTESWLNRAIIMLMLKLAV